MPSPVCLFVLAVVAGALAGCTRAAPSLDRDGDGVVRVLCLGDSNTASGDERIAEKWCENLAARYPSWQLVNQGKGFARATGTTMLWGRALLTHVWPTKPDLLLIALGTNDLLAGQQSPQVTVDALLAFRDEALKRNVDVAIATIPPAFNRAPEITAPIAVANRLLAGAVPADRLIDFYSGMTADDFLPDGIHVNAAGQRKRGDAATRVLVGLGAPTPAPH